MGVHPSVPDVDIKTADWLPEFCEDWMGEVSRVRDRDGAAGLDDKQRDAVPDRVGDNVVVSVGREGVKVDQEEVGLLQVLQGVVELLHHGRPEDAGELLVLLADDVIEDLVWTLECDLHTTLVGLGAGSQRPHGGHVVMDESLMLPGQRELDLHLTVLVCDGVDCVAFPQPKNIVHFSLCILLGQRFIVCLCYCHA